MRITDIARGLTRRLLLFLAGSTSIIAGAAAMAPKPAPISLEEIVDHGQASYRIVTPAATWVYHREGAGFSSVFDSAGNDWISYRPTGGAAGHYRGIPNAVFRRDAGASNFFHPGHSGAKGSTTTLVRSSPTSVVLQSHANDGRWACEWEILSDRARLRVTRVPPNDNGYWFLYEGTPGGRFDPNDLCLRADGRVSPLSERWEDSAKSVPWVAFISRAGGRALIVISHEPPETRVSYRPMENAMTVFGFGRTHASLDNLLTRPLTFTVALVAETDPARIAQLAEVLGR